jgi:FkbM family methyltransferase
VELLTKNLDGAGLLSKVQILPCLAYSHRILLTKAAMSDTGWNVEHESNRPAVPWRPTKNSDQAVEAFPLDVHLPLNAPVRFIKIDAQGCDLRVLHGLQQTIDRCRPLIVFEWEKDYAAWHGDTWEDYLAWGETHHYAIERITESFWDYVARPI